MAPASRKWNDERPLLLPQRLDVVVSRPARCVAAALGRQSGLDLHLPQLRLQKRRAAEGVVLVLVSKCQMMVVILRAVATAAIGLPRFFMMRMKNERSGPGAAAAAQAASTKSPRAWARPIFEMRP